MAGQLLLNDKATKPRDRGGVVQVCAVISGNAGCLPFGPHQSPSR